MNFLEAVKCMEEGLKVKRKEWTGDACCFTTTIGSIIDMSSEGNELNSLKIEHIEATDWEVVEEKTTLSDKRCFNHPFFTSTKYPCYKEEDVREVLKNFLEDYVRDRLSTLKLRNTELFDCAKKFFGERLIK